MKDGTIYEGNWLNNKQHGQGILKDTKGKILKYGEGDAGTFKKEIQASEYTG